MRPTSRGRRSSWTAGTPFGEDHAVGRLHGSREKVARVPQLWHVTTRVADRSEDISRTIQWRRPQRHTRRVSSLCPRMRRESPPSLLRQPKTTKPLAESIGTSRVISPPRCKVARLKPLSCRGIGDPISVDLRKRRETMFLRLAGTEDVHDTGASDQEGIGQQRSVALPRQDRKSTRLNSSHMSISYAVFCLK